MCAVCWASYGRPKLFTPNVQQALTLIEALYEVRWAGGNLHVQLEDYKLDDRYFDSAELISCIDEPVLPVERELYALLRGMSPAERVSAIALFDKYWTPDAC